MADSNLITRRNNRRRAGLLCVVEITAERICTRLIHRWGGKIAEMPRRKLCCVMTIGACQMFIHNMPDMFSGVETVVLSRTGTVTGQTAGGSMSAP